MRPLAMAVLIAGITSACAEKSAYRQPPHIRRWNYLRMRGEEESKRLVRSLKVELPPHARRRVHDEVDVGGVLGITSACAEKSSTLRAFEAETRNYLRMRGEEAHVFTGDGATQELPPHARRREISTAHLHHCFGITSACAEKRLRYLRKL